MKWISLLTLSLLLMACGRQYDGVHAREVIVAEPPTIDQGIDVTADKTNYGV